MGPCEICGKPGSFGAPHPSKKTAVWACAEHRKALPKRDDRNYAGTEQQDREAAMRYAASRLAKAAGMEAVKAIGKDAFKDAFEHGLDAYFAMRAHQLEP